MCYGSLRWPLRHYTRVTTTAAPLPPFNHLSTTTKSYSLPQVVSIPNPRVEAEEHYYNAKCTKLRWVGACTAVPPGTAVQGGRWWWWPGAGGAQLQRQLHQTQLVIRFTTVVPGLFRVFPGGDAVLCSGGASHRSA
jgi:hypothetical protein